MAKLKWWWLVIVGVLGLAAVAIVFTAQQPPYGFLAGFEETELKLTETERKMAEKEGVGVAAFRSRTNFAEVVRKAEAELMPAGYKKESDPGAGGAAFVKGSFMSSSGSSGKPQMPQIIVLLKDKKIPDNMAAASLFVTFMSDKKDKDKGWVSVVILGHREQNFFDKFKGWLGLQ